MLRAVYAPADETLAAALMAGRSVAAETRIDAGATRLIEDKRRGGDWSHHERRSGAFLVSASAWTPCLTARVIQPGETPEGLRAIPHVRV